MASDCYWVKRNSVLKVDVAATPCGTNSGSSAHPPCCVSGDTCLQNGLCHYTHTLDRGSGYYASACSDNKVGEGGCPKLCWSRSWPDVVYNETIKRWQCCGPQLYPNGTEIPDTKDCTNPTTEYFDAPAPADLKAYVDVASSSTSSSAISVGSSKTSVDSSKTSLGTGSITTVTASTTLLSTASSTSHPNKSLSESAKIGIGVGVSLGIVAIVFLLGACVWYRRRQRHHNQVLARNHIAHDPKFYPPAELSGAQMAEVPSDHKPIELPSEGRH